MGCRFGVHAGVQAAAIFALIGAPPQPMSVQRVFIWSEIIRKKCPGSTNPVFPMGEVR